MLNFRWYKWMLSALAVIFVTQGLLFAGDVKKAPQRSEIDPRYQWRLEDIYPDDESWEKDFSRLEPLLEKFDAYRGKLGESPATLLGYLQLDEEVTRLAVGLAFYAARKYDEDTRVTRYQGYRDRMNGIFSRLGQKTAFYEPEILTIPEEQIWELVDGSEELQVYRQYFKNLLRTKAHILSEKEEKLLAMAGEVTQTPTSVFQMFDNADLKFPNITDENGNLLELTKGRYQAIMRSSNRELRKQAWDAYYQSYESWKNTLAANLAGEVKKNIFYSRARNYSSALEASMDGDNLPVSVYDNLIVTVNNHLEPLQRYISFRKRILGIDKVHLYDLYAPLLSDFEWKVTYDEATQLVLKASEKLGKEYQQSVNLAFTNGWIDVYENQGKRSGAYNASFYGLPHPYLLLNYQDQVSDLFTLAHEIGHSMHSHLTHQNQPYIYGGYSAFLAEVASTFNEALLTDYMLSREKNKQRRLYLLNQDIENILTTIYTQVLYAEFEKMIHEKAEQGEPLNAEGMNRIFAELQQKYYGPDFALDPMGASRWNRIPHFYRNFYVYKYATGMAASAALSRQVIQGNKNARDAYLKFLSSGRSDYDINLLKMAGVDMTTPQAIEASLIRFDELLSEMEKLM